MEVVRQKAECRVLGVTRHISPASSRKTELSLSRVQLTAFKQTRKGAAFRTAGAAVPHVPFRLQQLVFALSFLQQLFGFHSFFLLVLKLHNYSMTQLPHDS
ncbi:MAG: hypothetical protein DMG65_17625 [Candidatus Angelobacter sp. Gp1-AA117]|nr:MAG: hypothetical protein DMG65_17625 [Candidatus Angelobacter sp. Gp1-AA117]